MDGDGYRPEFDRTAYLMALQDASDSEIAVFFRISREMYARWQVDHPSFEAAIERGRATSEYMSVSEDDYRRHQGGGWGNTPPDTGVSAARLRAVTSRTYVADEAGGTSNKDIRWTEHHPFGFRFTGRLYSYWPNWMVASTGAVAGGGVEVGSGGTMSAMCKITYYDATSGLQVTKNYTDTVGGTTTMTAADGGDCIGYVDVDIAAGSHPTIDGAAVFGNQMIFSQNLSDANNGDVFQFGTTWLNGSTDLATMLATTPTTSGGVTRPWYGAYRIIGLSTVKAASILGDSRQRYLDIPNDLYGCVGMWDRMIGPYMPTTNLSRPSESAADFANPANNPKRIAALKADGDYLLNGLGINDVYFFTRTAAQLDIDNTAIEAMIGLPAYRATLDPVVVSNSNNTVSSSAGDARRQTYNAIVRALPYYYDPPASNESGSSGTFASTTYVNADGTHETNVGHANPINNTSATALRAHLGLTSAYTFVAWDLPNLDPTGLNWWHPSDFTVSSWPARIGGVGAIQGTAGSQPSADAGGGGVWSSGKSMTSAYSASGATLTAFAVITIPSLAGSDKAILGASATAGREWRIGTTGLQALNSQSSAVKSSGTAKAITAGRKEIAELIEVKSASTKIRHGVNGDFEDGSASNTAYTASLTTVLGNTNNNSDFMVGSIHEKVLLNYTPTTAIRQKIEGALAVRHSTQANLISGHPYITYGPTL